ncbi:S-phase kinase-associated protein 2-like [Oratosquilla oratoria]|uniref:S-phase kinase-associated protein 2-like n=1 Tax=Oratosquilla oratoria TaxID=337810 RepID=UPI003F75FE40
MQTGKRESDKENQVVSKRKYGRWSLGDDVGNDPPLLADMGLSVLSADEECQEEAAPTLPVTGSKTVVPPNAPKVQVLHSIDQNVITQEIYISEPVEEEEFFVYKRRRINIPSEEDTINRLKDELIIRVFHFLPKYMLARCAQVCWRWKRLAFDGSLWRRLDLGGKTLQTGVVGRVILRGASILRLAKAEIGSPIFSPTLQYLPDIRSHLQYLDLSMAAIQPEALEEMLSVCHNLKKLSLEHCSLNEHICKHIARNTNLDTLNLAMCYGLNHNSLLPIVSNCKKLQSVNLAWIGLTGEDLRAICHRFPPTIERLNLSGCKQTLTDTHVRWICEDCPKLQELDLSDCTQLTAAVICTIIRTLHHVEYLAFARCYSIQPDAYLELQQIPSLLYLDVFGILSEAALNTVRESLPKKYVNKYYFSSVARPTVGIKRTSIWGFRVRD